MKLLVGFLVLATSFASAQLGQTSNTIDVTGDAAINVAPDRVTLNLGVETRNKNLSAAISRNDSLVKDVISKIRSLQVKDADIQTEDIHVKIGYANSDPTVVEYYDVTKGIQVTLRDVTRFEGLLTAALGAGANQIYGVEFSTSELR